MGKPFFFAAKMPAQVILKHGQHWWCACGKKSNQPFCNGSHHQTEFVPVAFKIAEKQETWLCRCKQTKNPPYCDRTQDAIKNIGC